MNGYPHAVCESVFDSLPEASLDQYGQRTHRRYGVVEDRNV